MSFLLCCYGGSVAQAAAGPLDSIESPLISGNFPLEGGIEVETGDAQSQAIPGCSQVKTFQLSGAGNRGEVIVALCEGGKFGPNNIDATLGKWVADSRESFKTMPPHVALFMLAGADPLPVVLEGGRQGKAMTLPAVGHGFALIPLAYAVMPKGDATVVVQAYLDPNNPRVLTEPIAVLLQGIYKRLQQKKDGGRSH